MDDFTLSLLTNDEVLAINQDILGKQATQISNQEGKIVYAKTLEDGSYAVGLFNRGETETSIEVKWGPWGTLATPDAGATFVIRDLWRQHDLGEFKSKFETKVAPHGVVLIRLTHLKKNQSGRANKTTIQAVRRSGDVPVAVCERRATRTSPLREISRITGIRKFASLIQARSNRASNNKGDRKYETPSGPLSIPGRTTSVP